MIRESTKKILCCNRELIEELETFNTLHQAELGENAGETEIPEHKLLLMADKSQQFANEWKQFIAQVYNA